jgi:histidinol dehydrogenase
MKKPQVSAEIERAMKTAFLQSLKKEQIEKLVQRPSINLELLFPKVRQILLDVKRNGDRAVGKYTKRFDNIDTDNFEVSRAEWGRADKTKPEIKQAIKIAAENIKKFHRSQLVRLKKKPVETKKGVQGWQEARPIERVGLYIPTGLVSTTLMLGIPAKLAGCKVIVMATPPDKEGKLSPEMLFAAKTAGISRIFKIGGAQAIAAMAFGTESLPKVDKIFGPGNQYVTAAKLLVSIDPEGATIDLPAGPSEILVVADDKANPAFVAADLLSQLEHGLDSQAVLATDSQSLVIKTEKEISSQLLQYQAQGRTLRITVKNLLAVIVQSTEAAIEFANLYAPEHLVLNVREPGRHISKIKNAGSVFLGQYSSVAAGDYASGTNHVLPTSGFARSYSGLSIDSFLKKITFQKISRTGLKTLTETVVTLTEIEKMPAHKNALAVRSS